jgi:hypothetical protein
MGKLGLKKAGSLLIFVCFDFFGVTLFVDKFHLLVNSSSNQIRTFLDQKIMDSEREELAFTNLGGATGSTEHTYIVQQVLKSLNKVKFCI